MNKISIVIPAYNAEKTVSGAIEACLAQSYPSQDREIIVVDDGSSDATAEIIKRYPVRYLYQPNGGPAKARNLGWRSGDGEIIFFTDSDCAPEKDWVVKLLRSFDSGKIAAAGGSYDIRNPGDIVALAIHDEIQYRHASLPEFVKYLGSFNLAVRRSALEEAGGFDESFRIACGEDADLSYRLVDKGYLLRFCAGCNVGHYFPKSAAGFLRQQFWRGFWVMKLFFKHRGKVGRDDYGSVKDAIQPPLFLLIVLLAPLCRARIIFEIWLLLNIIAVLIHTPVVRFAVKKSGSGMLLLYPLLYLRGFFWAAGSSAGLIRFYREKK